MAGTNPLDQGRWLVFPDTDALAEAVADHVGRACSQAVQGRGEFHLVVPGGTTPRKLLLKLRQRDLPWRDIHLYLTDERCLPPGHAGRNDHMIDELLLPDTDLPSGNLHRIPAELGPETGAQQFAQQLRDTPPFDLVILGMGEDGHTASLFSTVAPRDDGGPVVAVFDAPKPPPERVSLGLSRLLAARERIVIAAGAGKRDILQRIQEGEDFPITRARPDTWYLDTDAAP